MESKNERMIAYSLTAILLVVGVICYAAFAKETPQQPMRIMFKNTGGNVLFDHKEHLSESGYGIDCSDCHHDIENEGDKPAACSECHTPDGEEAPKRSDAFHNQCKNCHSDGGGPVNCSECHAM
ncbi:MAG: cytochrome c3 family protein [Deltaproteobacteria bacterium]|nr:cytochrome c3 family protein [Deltaproteobacteria bacterium]